MGSASGVITAVIGRQAIEQGAIFGDHLSPESHDVGSYLSLAA